MKKARRYFSFFGMLLATSNAKLTLIYSKLSANLNKLPNIKKELNKTQLKPIKQYSTNNL